MQPGKIYHIYNHGNADDNLFRSNENYSYFLRKYEEHIYPIATTYAFCLMPNHFHFLLKIKDASLLEKLPDFNTLTSSKQEERIIKRFSNFFNGYTKAFNKMFERRGKLFLLPFKRKPITNQWHFLNTWKYIHYNPVHHGFCQSPYEWAFCSVHDYHLKNSLILDFEEAIKNADSLLEFKEPNEFKPNWTDFFDVDY
jgi:putative transposase